MSVFFLVLLIKGIQAEPTYSRQSSCKVWKGIAEEIEEEARLRNATCGVNSRCTGVDCTAIYTFKVQYYL